MKGQSVAERKVPADSLLHEGAVAERNVDGADSLLHEGAVARRQGLLTHLPIRLMTNMPSLLSTSPLMVVSGL